MHTRRLLNNDVCKKTYLNLTREGEATHAAQRQAVAPGKERPFDLQALQKKRSDLRDSVTTSQQEDSNADYWAPAEKPVTKNEKLFVQVVGEHIIKHFGEALPHRSVINRATKCRRVQVNIPNGLFASRTELLSILKSSHLLPEDFAESTFYYYLRKFYFFVCFQKWTPFSKCDVCARLKQLIIGCKPGDPRLPDLQAELQAHRDQVQLARARLNARAQLARSFPQHFLHLIIDGMDSAKTWSPHVVTHFLASKGFSHAGKHLQTKLVGVLAEGICFSGYVTYPHYEQGANLMVTVLQRALVNHITNFGSLPPVLFLQLDNCGRENKNHTVLAYLAWLVQERVFHRIYIDFLPVGELQFLL
jgi:hypothetical protein